ARLHVVALDHHDRWGDVERGERLPAARAAEAGVEGPLVDVRPVRRVPDPKPAVRDLRRLLDALRPDRRDVDRDLAAVEDRAEGLTEPGRVRARVRDLVVLAPVDDWLVAGPDLAHDRHVLARLHEWLPEPLPVPALDDLRPRDPEP